MEKSADAFRTISEVADDLSLPQHVLRFWETRFVQIRPLKRAGGRRYYRPTDVSLLKAIRQLLYDDGYTIKGVQRLLKEQGAKGLSTSVPPADFDRADTNEVEAALLEAAQALDADDVGPGMAVASPREAIENALATIDECKRILDALLPTSGSAR